MHVSVYVQARSQVAKEGGVTFHMTGPVTRLTHAQSNYFN